MLWPSDISMVQRYNDPLSTGCYEIDLKVFRRLHLRSEAVQAFTALGKFITITVQRFLRRKRNQRALARSASPLSDFTVAVGQGLLMADGR